MICESHDWREMGVRRKHIQGAEFKYGTPFVNYVRCVACKQIGFRKSSSRVVYTWEQDART